MYCNQWLTHDEKAAYAPMDRPAWGAWWDQVGEIHRGQIGTAESRLFSIQDYVDTLLDAFIRQAGRDPP